MRSNYPQVVRERANEVSSVSSLILPTYYFMFHEATERTNERIFSLSLLNFCDLSFFSAVCAFKHYRVQHNAITSSRVSDFCSHARSSSFSSCARSRKNSIFAHFRSGETSPHETTTPVELRLVAHGQSRADRQLPDHVGNIDLHRSGDQPRTGEVDNDHQSIEPTRASERIIPESIEHEHRNVVRTVSCKDDRREKRHGSSVVVCRLGQTVCGTRAGPYRASGVVVVVIVHGRSLPAASGYEHYRTALPCAVESDREGDR